MFSGVLSFHLFPTEKIADLLCNDHQGLKAELESLSNSFEQRKTSGFFLFLLPEHFLPCLVSSEEKTHANRLDTSIINF